MPLDGILSEETGRILDELMHLTNAAMSNSDEGFNDSPPEPPSETDSIEGEAEADSRSPHTKSGKTAAESGNTASAVLGGPVLVDITIYSTLPKGKGLHHGTIVIRTKLDDSPENLKRFIGLAITDGRFSFEIPGIMEAGLTGVRYVTHLSIPFNRQTIPALNLRTNE